MENINLELVKASYNDEIISLRYKNDVTNFLDTLYLISDYYNILEKKGFKLIRNESNKRVYVNNQYEVIIKESFNYLIIIIMEL